MKKQIYHYIQTMLLSVLLIACEDTLFSSISETEDTGLESFRVEFNVAEAVNADGTPVTRSAPDDVSSTKVSNVWVFQFDGTTNKLQTTPRYVEAGNDGSLSVGAIPSDNALLLFIANTNLPGIDWKATKGITTYQQILQLSGKRYYEDENYGTEKRNLLMCGTRVGKITLGDHLTPTLYRSVAKIEFTLKVNENIPYEVQTVRLCNVPDCIYWSAPLLTTTNYDLVPKALESRFGKGPDTTTGHPAPGGSAVTYTWYLPTNIRGTSKNELSKDKNKNAPAHATFIEIGVKDTGASGGGRFYRIYPGANMTNDFNIKANHEYKLTLNLTTETIEDSRIEIAQSKTLGESNCYLLNPPPAGSNAIEFSIPVVDRVNRFYQTPSYSNIINKSIAFSGFEEADEWECRVIWCDNKDLLEYGQTTVESNSKLYISGHEGNGGSEKHMKIVLPPLTPQQYGNILIGIYKKGETICRWSWHLWVTDYNPNVSVTTANDRFAFDVVNGQVVRFACSLFGYYSINPYQPSNVQPSSRYDRAYSEETTPNIAYPYREGYLMDRNLGARAAYGSPTDVAGLVYQYGRKDPFVIRSIVYDANGTPSETIDYTSTNAPKFKNRLKAMQGTNYQYTMSDAHEKPTYIFTSLSTYLGNNEYNTTAFEGDNVATPYYTWHDILLPFKNGTVPDKNTDPWNRYRKSLFDPCPEGWQVMNPETDTYASPSLSAEATLLRVPGNNGSNIGWASRGLSMNGVYGQGLYYWPEISRFVDQKPAPIEGVIFFPYSSVIDEFDGAFKEAESRTASAYWLGSRSEKNYQRGYALFFTPTNTQLKYVDQNQSSQVGAVRSKACAIRCVKTPVTP